MSQRIFGVVLLLACLGLMTVAWGYHAPYSYEPVGPRAYPMLLLILMALGAIHLLLKPSGTKTDDREQPMDKLVFGKVGTCVGLFLLYAATFEPLGFILSSVLFGITMARLYAGTWLISLVSGPVLAVGLYVLFDRVLDVPLPLGLLSSLEF